MRVTFIGYDKELVTVNCESFRFDRDFEACEIVSVTGREYKVTGNFRKQLIIDALEKSNGEYLNLAQYQTSTKSDGSMASMFAAASLPGDQIR